MIKAIEDTLDFINEQTQSSIIKGIWTKENKLINKEYEE